MPSISRLTRIWQASLEVPVRCAEPSSRSLSSPLMGGSRSANVSSTYTWHVAQEQHPPHRASNSPIPWFRMPSITENPSSTSNEASAPSRVTTAIFAIEPRIAFCSVRTGSWVLARSELKDLGASLAPFIAQGQLADWIGWRPSFKGAFWSCSSAQPNTLRSNPTGHRSPRHATC